MRFRYTFLNTLRLVGYDHAKKFIDLIKRTDKLFLLLSSVFRWLLPKLRTWTKNWRKLQRCWYQKFWPITKCHRLFIVCLFPGRKHLLTDQKVESKKLGKLHCLKKIRFQLLSASNRYDQRIWKVILLCMEER